MVRFRSVYFRRKMSKGRHGMNGVMKGFREKILAFFCNTQGHPLKLGCESFMADKKETFCPAYTVVKSVQFSATGYSVGYQSV